MRLKKKANRAPLLIDDQCKENAGRNHVHEQKAKPKIKHGKCDQERQQLKALNNKK